MKKIKSIEIVNSTFYGDDIKIDFSDKLNCIMGGRGTGKSTLLYFIQSALDNNAESQSIIANILKANLRNGIVKLTIEDEEGKEYEIEKSFGDEPQIQLKSNKRLVSIDSFSDSFECDIYPALSIEEIGKNSLDRLKLIDKRIRVETAALKNDIRSIQISLRQNAVSIRTENARTSQIKEQLLNYKAAEEDLKIHKEGKPDDIKQEEQAEFEKADGNEKIRTAENRYALKVVKNLTEVKEGLESLNEEIQGYISSANDTKAFLNKGELAKVKAELENTLKVVLASGTSNISLIQQSITRIAGVQEQLKDLHKNQQNEFVKLKQKFDKHKEYINKYNLLSRRVDEKQILEKEVLALEAKTKKIKTQRALLIKELNSKKQELFTLRKNVVNELNTELSGSVKITLSFGGITEEYENLLRNSLRGSNLRYNAIIPYIVQNLSPDRFAAAIHKKDFNVLKDVAQIDEERSKAIIEALFETQDIYELEALYCEDLPEFFLKIDAKGDTSKVARENYKKSDELSTGQRCTTVLPIVFAVSDNPLVIDQPEDNLDNKYITDSIHSIIRQQKEKRQLIFITHNPNIPVLSDAEFNVFLNYDNKQSRIDSSGSIETVKSNILGLLEGGREAFERRKALYGEN